MLAELTIFPLGVGPHTSLVLADILRIVDASGLPYVLTPSGTCIEGDWDQIMMAVKKCHEKARSHCTHVVTELRIEDDADSSDKLHENIASVEMAAGHPLQKHLPQPKPEQRKEEIDEIC
jgi:uncharacterized protein (TIGR00106 family)